MEFSEKKLDGSLIYDGKVIKVKKDRVLLPNGNTSYREIVNHNGGSCIYCEKDGKILFVKQFRYAFNEQVLELPAGKREGEEDFSKTAIRELEEEGGLKAESVKLLATAYPSPGYTSEVICIYRAENTTPSKQHFDDDEFLNIVWIEKGKVKEMIKDGVIKDAKTLLALLTVFYEEK